MTNWNTASWIVERTHDLCVAGYILSSIFAPPSWLTLHPVILMIMCLNWFDPSGQCCITKFARYLNNNDSISEKWKYSKVSTQKQSQYQNTDKHEEFQNPIQNLFRGETDEEKIANKAAFFSLYFMSSWAFLAWYRVCYFYNLPFLDEAPLRFVVAFYFVFWLTVTLFV